MLAESEQQPRKQRYTARRIYQLIREEGYPGSESTVRRYVGRKRESMRRPDAYLPLEFDPGQDAQMDWTEAVAEIAWRRQTVQLFVMRLNRSRARFVMAFPFQKQEAFFEGHIQAFSFFGGVPRRISYDNLKTAVYRILKGRNRQEQEALSLSAAITCLRATTALRVRRMRKGAWRATWATPCATLWRPCQSCPPLRL